jgi:hypothetical protein
MNQQSSIPTDWKVELADGGTTKATWTLLRDHDDVGVIAESRLAAKTGVPDNTVLAWVAECLEVTGTVLIPTTEPGVWSVRITY